MRRVFFAGFDVRSVPVVGVTDNGDQWQVGYSWRYTFSNGFPQNCWETPNWPNGFLLRYAEASPWSSPRAISCLGLQPV